MLMSLVEELRFGTVFPELAGSRVLISGVSSQLGVDISRAFADHKARLLLQMSETSIAMDEVANMLALSACDLKIYNGHLLEAEEATKFAKGPAQQAFGGLDVIINLITLTPADLVSAGELEDIEAIVSHKLLSPTLMSRVVANRMRLTMNDGLILNVLHAPPVHDARSAALASLIGATLATITRKEAENWAPEGIRINAITHGSATEDMLSGSMLGAPEPVGEPELAALALYLASKRGAMLSGQVYDTANVSIA